MIICAVDPGERHCGMALVGADLAHASRREFLDSSRDGRLGLLDCFELSPDACADYVAAHAWSLDRLVIEQFRLYPWMARQQGFSSFGTCETIGALRYVARQTELPVILQDASGNKRDGRKIATEQGFRMANRKIGKGRFAYWGPDFDLPGDDHRRDAAAHGVAYAWSQLTR